MEVDAVDVVRSDAAPGDQLAQPQEEVLVAGEAGDLRLLQDFGEGMERQGGGTGAGIGGSGPADGELFEAPGLRVVVLFSTMYSRV